MAKRRLSDEGLPYFKFFPTKWQNGSIDDCSLQAQGLFINLCIRYWGRRGDITLSSMKAKFKRKEKLFAELIDADVIKVINDRIQIIFLDEQLMELNVLSEKNRRNAYTRWNHTNEDATAYRPHSDGNTNAMLIEENRIEENRIEENNTADADGAKKKVDDEIPFPDGSPVRSAWNEWEKYRKEKKQRLTPSTIKKQLQFLGGRGDPEIIAIINQSIRNGWTGLFELKKQYSHDRKANKRTSDAVIEGGRDFGSF